MSTIEDIATRIHGSKMFNTLDANMGYFQFALHANSQPLTCFITPFGRSMDQDHYRNVNRHMHK